MLSLSQHPGNAESRIRRRALRKGYVVHKSRSRSLHSNNFGEYMLCDDRNCVVFGSRFDASLSEIEAFLRNDS